MRSLFNLTLLVLVASPNSGTMDEPPNSYCDINSLPISGLLILISECGLFSLRPDIREVYHLSNGTFQELLCDIAPLPFTLSLNIDGTFICENFEQIVLQLCRSAGATLETMPLWIKCLLFYPPVLINVPYGQKTFPHSCEMSNFLHRYKLKLKIL